MPPRPSRLRRRSHSPAVRSPTFCSRAAQRSLGRRRVIGLRAVSVIGRSLVLGLDVDSANPTGEVQLYEDLIAAILRTPLTVVVNADGTIDSLDGIDALNAAAEAIRACREYIGGPAHRQHLCHARHQSHGGGCQPTGGANAAEW